MNHLVPIMNKNRKVPILPGDIVLLMPNAAYLSAQAGILWNKEDMYHLEGTTVEVTKVYSNNIEFIDWLNVDSHWQSNIQAVRAILSHTAIPSPRVGLRAICVEDCVPTHENFCLNCQYGDTTGKIPMTLTKALRG